jgi:hypothetical protein
VKVTPVDADICLVQYADPQRPVCPEDLESAKQLIRSEGHHRHVALMYECPEWVKALAYNYFDVVAIHQDTNTFTVQMTHIDKYLFDEVIVVPVGLLPDTDRVRVGTTRKRLGHSIKKP